MPQQDLAVRTGGSVVEGGGAVGHQVGILFVFAGEKFQELLQVGRQQLRRGVRRRDVIISIELAGQIDHAAGAGSGVQIIHAGDVVEQGHAVESLFLALDVVALLGQDPGHESVEALLIAEGLLHLVLVYGGAVLPDGAAGEVDLQRHRLVLHPHGFRAVGRRRAAGGAVASVVVACYQVVVQIGVPVAGGQGLAGIEADLAEPVRIRAGVQCVDHSQLRAVGTDGHQGTAQHKRESVKRVLYAGSQDQLAGSHEGRSIRRGDAGLPGGLLDQRIHNSMRIERGKGSCHLLSSFLT